MCVTKGLSTRRGKKEEVTFNLSLGGKSDLNLSLEKEWDRRQKGGVGNTLREAEIAGLKALR